MKRASHLQAIAAAAAVVALLAGYYVRTPPSPSALRTSPVNPFEPRVSLSLRADIHLNTLGSSCSCMHLWARFDCTRHLIAGYYVRAPPPPSAITTSPLLPLSREIKEEAVDNITPAAHDWLTRLCTVVHTMLLCQLYTPQCRRL